MPSQALRRGLYADSYKIDPFDLLWAPLGQHGVEGFTDTVVLLNIIQKHRPNVNNNNNNKTVTHRATSIRILGQNLQLGVTQ